MAESLIRVRAGTLNSMNSICFPGAVVAPPVKAMACSMDRWEPIVRYYTCLFDLVGSVKFEATWKATTGTGPIDQVEAVLKNGSNISIAHLTRPSAAVFRAQIARVQTWSSLREDRANELISQIAPPLPFWAAVVGMQPVRHKWTLEIVNLALAFAAICAFRFKQEFGCPRPAEYSPDVQPIIPTPEHSSLPSGHATEAFMVANILAALGGPGRRGATSAPPASETFEQRLSRLAGRIAINRTVAGVHFPVDSWAGMVLGNALAGHFLNFVGALNKPDPCSDNVISDTNFDPRSDLLRKDIAKVNQDCDLPSATTPNMWMWRKAVAEWL